jgi:hypothetical protein
MGSSSKRQTTMAKMARERALKERRALKQQKKDERKAAAAEQKAAVRSDRALPGGAELAANGNPSTASTTRRAGAPAP